MRANTRIKMVMDEIRFRVSSRTYPAGTRLPSVRAQAKIMQVSVSTVVEAYERLMAEGIITSRPGAGFYVLAPTAPLALKKLQPKIDRAVDPLWISRQALETDANVIKPGCGWLPPDWLYESGMRRALRNLAKTDAINLVEYATPLGNPALRQFLTRRLANMAIDATAEQILLTESGTQAIDLICRYLLEPGDTVLVDDPCYFNFHALLKAHRIQVIGIPYTPHGPDIEIFETVLKEHSPRLYITNSGIHNPTGATLSPVIAHKLLKLVDNTNLVIIEDDIFSDFENAHAPRLASFDGLSRVIQIGSFSKTISASLRCGYIVAQSEWIEDLVDLKIATSFGGARLASDMVLMTLTDSGYRKHMDMIKLKLENEMINVISRLKAIGIEPWITPKAGMFLWCKLPKGLDAAVIAKECLKQDIILAPGNAFSYSLNAQDFMRFNVAQSTDERIFTVLKNVLTAQMP